MITYIQIYKALYYIMSINIISSPVEEILNLIFSFKNNMVDDPDDSN